MFQFIETIKFKDGKLFNLSYHNDRLNRTRRAFYSINDGLNLAERIELPSAGDGSIYKCRIVYDRTILKVEFVPYEERTVKKLKIITANDIAYSYKYEDRRHLEHLFNEKGECDDILIIKNNMVTDSFYANVVLYDGHEWITPSTPLLSGTQRAYLLDKGIIKEKNITLESLKDFQKIRLINAMVSFNEAQEIEIDSLVFNS